ncbi:hypothetical protein KAFR_0J01490 [Kazachstania africana CBS 2517]|uniref:6-phosphofructo-2-kinase domain-containing protein n=1 Tax=Kazachstania africana (strain ATCC 22294 / BCRC 22015 / CBS 2517 / CECT 1963 / NBRC 1671 / NRRL Y-8276) TaxID=1071382 RepID=H2B0R5_KAZAF|nr:hypothetical protein KAFR_0J01490 [Kazachstania africana CBS 2517]CCF60215.1 hypothetical protein KAFR_0J01490 [Kazachstania africana CBS 2517]
MFRKVKYIDDSLTPDSSESDIEPKARSIVTNPSNSTPSSTSSSSGTLKDMLPKKKHVTIQLDDEQSKRLDSLPSFKRRPLSDTPVTSTWTSPSVSASPSPVPSTLQLPSLSRLQKGETTPVTSGSRSPSKFSHRTRRPTTIDVPGLTKSKTSPDGLISKEDSGSKLIIIMVGLPATGKSFITNKLSRYLNYSMYYCKVFNVGNTRRRFAKKHNLSDQDSKFFDPSNENSSKLRDKWALDTLDELLDYLLEGPGSVAVFDATNTTRTRRKKVLEKIRERNSHLKVLYLESICTNRTVVENNIKLKLFGPDYKGKNPEESLKDFKERLANYLRAYEPIEDDENIPYIKMIDVGKKIISYKIEGFLASQTVYYLLNFNLTERQIWITRNGESEDNMLGRLGGDSHLTSRGLKYAQALTRFMDEQREIFYFEQLKKKEANEIYSKNDIIQTYKENGTTDPISNFFVWTSMRQRSVETAQYFNEDDYPIKQMRMLDELSAGDYEGMTYSEIRANFPKEFAKRQKDKLRYRYPGIAGESYMDVINRLRPVITELERIDDSVLIVTHRVVARALLGYYMNLNVDVISNLDVPLHCVYCLETKPYGITWSLWEYDEKTDCFSKVPESHLNTTKVREVGLVYKERKYSVVPTAPPTNELGSSDFLNRRRASVGFEGDGLQQDSGTIDEKVLASEPITSSNIRSEFKKADMRPIPRKSSRERFQIDQLNEKLSSLKTDLGTRFRDATSPDASDNSNITSNNSIKMTRSHSQT